jgi:hypothetical protein
MAKRIASFQLAREVNILDREGGLVNLTAPFLIVSVQGKGVQVPVPGQGET